MKAKEDERMLIEFKLVDNNYQILFENPNTVKEFETFFTNAVIDYINKWEYDKARMADGIYWRFLDIKKDFIRTKEEIEKLPAGEKMRQNDGIIPTPII